MTPDTLSFSGLVLMLVLGLRHGLDPDHIAIIDALSLRMAEKRSRWAPWTGSFFAIGHGAVVTLIAVGVSLGAQILQLPNAAYAVAQWVPVALLAAVAAINLRGLLRRGPFKSGGWITRLIPQRLLGASHPLSVVAVGAIFAAIFDTITQATAWGYIATQNGGAPAALLAGGVFTLGMMVTDTLDSQLLCRLLRTGSADTIERRQRLLGWAIVALSLSVVAYSLVSHFWPALTVGEAGYTAIGAASVGALLALLLRAHWRRQSPVTLSHPTLANRL